MSDLIDRQQAIDVLHEYFDGMFLTDTVCPKDIYNLFEIMPSAQPEEAIPISWIEGKITRFIEMDNAFSGLTVSIMRAMVNEWKREQERRTECD